MSIAFPAEIARTSKVLRLWSVEADWNGDIPPTALGKTRAALEKFPKAARKFPGSQIAEHRRL
jgi:hypothetical protein